MHALQDRLANPIADASRALPWPEGEFVARLPLAFLNLPAWRIRRECA